MAGRLEVASPGSPARTMPRAALSTSASIFNRFYAAQNGIRVQGPGAGLGLAINRRIAALRSGRRASNSIGPTLRAGNEPRQRAGNSRRSDYLLIVDSKGPFATELTAELAAVGLESFRACDAESAKQLLSRTARPTVVLDLRYAALPLVGAPPNAEALTG
jgi:hypothetical protein